MDAHLDSVRDEKTSPARKSSRLAVAAHVVPYLLWILPLAVFAVADVIGLDVPQGWLAPIYAAKSLLCALLLVWLRPWRFYAPSGASVQSSKFKVQSSSAATDCQACDRTENWELRTGNRRSGGQAVCLGLSVGVAVTLLWVLPESPWLFARASGFVTFYNRWLILPPADWPGYFRPDLFPALPAGHPSLAYAPETCGWGLTVAKLLGSAFVISVAEEYFFRGFLYRWLRKGDFLSLAPGRYDAATFWLVVAVFGLEHDRWLAGMAAGAAYGWLVLRTGRIGPAALAHAVTNLALGIYVILSHQYGFW